MVKCCVFFELWPEFGFGVKGLIEIGIVSGHTVQILLKQFYRLKLILKLVKSMKALTTTYENGGGVLLDKGLHCAGSHTRKPVAPAQGKLVSLSLCSYLISAANGSVHTQTKSSSRPPLFFLYNLTCSTISGLGNK
jgi:hypothetical protein